MFKWFLWALRWNSWLGRRFLTRFSDSVRQLPGISMPRGYFFGALFICCKRFPYASVRLIHSMSSHHDFRSIS
ncbi:unnamed protein product [Amoebophrya sp. A25]|nr:unnamed protein product [Amoebophrya sp. A25]|eukprot:GSA25T00016112001.1